jgi:hypothetical protein
MLNHLKIIGAVIFIVDKDGDRIFSKTFSQTIYTEMFKRILPRSFNSYSVSLTLNNDNKVVQVIKSKKAIWIDDFYEASRDAYPRSLSKVLSKLIGFRSGKIYPVIQDAKCLGAIFYAKNYMDDFALEEPILRAFNDIVAASLANAKRFEELLEQSGR